MRIKIALETQSEAVKLVQIAHQFPNDDIYISDETGHLRVHARSMMGVLYSMEFKDLWLESEKDHYHAFRDFAKE